MGIDFGAREIVKTDLTDEPMDITNVRLIGGFYGGKYFQLVDGYLRDNQAEIGSVLTVAGTKY